MGVHCTLCGHVCETRWNAQNGQLLQDLWVMVIHCCDWRAGVLQEVQDRSSHSHPVGDRELWAGACHCTDWWACCSIYTTDTLSHLADTKITFSSCASQRWGPLVVWRCWARKESWQFVGPVHPMSHQMVTISHPSHSFTLLQIHCG